MLLLHSIEPRHLTNQSHPRVPWATGFLLIVEYCIHHIIININDDDDVMEEKHDLSGGDAREQSNRCTLRQRSSILSAGSWRPFWFDHIFHSMIFGQVMANICHGGGSCTVVFRPFSEVVPCGVLCFFGGDVEEVQKTSATFFTRYSMCMVGTILTRIRPRTSKGRKARERPSCP